MPLWSGATNKPSVRKLPVTGTELAWKTENGHAKHGRKSLRARGTANTKCSLTVLKGKGKALPRVTTEGETANTCRSDARWEVDKHECHPAEGYNRSSSSTPSKHWADRDDEVMDYEAELVWDDNDEATGRKGVKLFKVAEKREKFLTAAFSSGVPNTTRRQWRDKYGAPNTTATACPNLDKVMKSRLPAVIKS